MSSDCYVVFKCDILVFLQGWKTEKDVCVDMIFVIFSHIILVFSQLISTDAGPIIPIRAQNSHDVQRDVKFKVAESVHSTSKYD